MRRAASLPCVALSSLSGAAMAATGQVAPGAKTSAVKSAAAKPDSPKAGTTMVASPRSYGPRLEGFDYPYPVHMFREVVQGQSVEMAYMELAPQHPNGRTVVLLHGKNFCAATWGDTAKVLAAGGYRVIVPDQIGFCKSSKPIGFQYSLYGMASMTADLLRSRGVTKADAGRSFAGRPDRDADGDRDAAGCSTR